MVQFKKNMARRGQGIGPKNTKTPINLSYNLPASRNHSYPVFNTNSVKAQNKNKYNSIVRNCVVVNRQKLSQQPVNSGSVVTRRSKLLASKIDKMSHEIDNIHGMFDPEARRFRSPIRFLEKGRVIDSSHKLMKRSKKQKEWERLFARSYDQFSEDYM